MLRIVLKGAFAEGDAVQRCKGLRDDLRTIRGHVLARFEHDYSLVLVVDAQLFGDNVVVGEFSIDVPLVEVDQDVPYQYLMAETFLVDFTTLNWCVATVEMHEQLISDVMGNE
jgi:hypothetical protein